MRKPKFTSDIIVGRAPLDVSALKLLATNEPKAFAGKVHDVIATEKLQFSDIMDLKGLFWALADCQVPVQMPGPNGQTREIISSAFPLLTGGLVVAGVNAAYEAVPTIGQDLVQDFSDNKKVTALANVQGLDVNVDRVDENQPFPEISASEEKLEIRHKRNGRQLSLSMEVIEENNTADFQLRINQLGEVAAEWIEQQTLQRVCDANGSKTSGAGEYYVYRPNGVGTALYNSTANNPGTRAPSGTRILNTALLDYQSLESGRVVLAAMVNGRGKRINVWQNSEIILLVPDALVGLANRILNSELVPGNYNEVNSWGPRGTYRPRVVSSPKLDDISTSAWYLGRFRRQFMRKWKLALEYASMTGDTAAFCAKRQAGCWRVAWDVEIGALDYVFVVQSLAGTTYTPTTV